MVEFLTGAALAYAIGAVQVYRERRGEFLRTPEDPGAMAAFKIALQWPLAVGPQR